MFGDDPVGSTGGGRHAPAMMPDDEPPTESHWCDAVGSRVYAPKDRCPACKGSRADPDGDRGDGE